MEVQASMDRSFARFADAVQADRIIHELQMQQHLRPHQSLDEAVQNTRVEAGFCPGAAQRAVELLHLDPARKVGRLKRCELTQLARTIYRLWRQNLDAAQRSQPA